MPREFKKSTGPLSAVIPVKNLQMLRSTFDNFPLETYRDGPRAGQAWEIVDANFRFPNAERNKGEPTTGLELGLEFAFTISMFFSGTEVARQEFLESDTRTVAEEGKEGEEEKVPMHLVGALEPFTAQALYGGESLGFQIKFKVTPKRKVAPVEYRMTAETGTEGLIILRYNRLT